MEEIVLIVFVLVFGVFGAMFFSLVSWSALFMHTLRYNHPKTWRSLGEPVFLTINLVKSIASVAVLIKFLLSKEYEKLNDMKFNRLCRKLKMLYPVITGVIILTVAVFVWWVKVSGQGL